MGPKFLLAGRFWWCLRLCLGGVVVAILAAAIYTLEQQRSERLLSESVNMGESITGEIISASVFEQDVTARQLSYIDRFP